MVKPPWDDLRGKIWRLSDSLSGETFQRDGDGLARHGLFVELAPWHWHFLRLETVR
jgi:hypothetical protein